MIKTLSKTAPLESFSIKNYKVLELIGSGGMANIYKAIQLSLDRPIALKIMHQHLTVDEGFVARFEKEAKQAAQLQHENIVSIIDYGADKGVYFIAMEHIEGKNLRDILDGQRRLPLEICLLICQQIAEGLKYAHSHNLIHRDIKPSNIILSYDGRVMLTDFGIAKGSDDLTITATGQMIGSPAYMSPEQAAGRPIDHRSDIFSLGIIMYEIIAGEKPFKGETYQDMVASIMSKEPELLKRLRIDVNEEIEAMVKKALVKDVYSRYQNADDFADRIYNELQRYKMPPVKKLISSFLNDPIKITNKLRTEKISNHMESALYYVTMGEGRLKEARKEFQEVLRYDRNNKAAREYLKKLEDHSDKSDGNMIPRKTITLKKKHVIWASIILALILSVLLARVIIGIKYDMESVHKLLNSTDGKSAAESKRTNNSGTDSGNALESSSDNGAAEKAPESTSRSATEKKQSSAVKKTPTSKKTTSAPKKTKAYAYPNQNLKEFGYLTVKTNVTAEIFIDKVDYGKSNGPPIKLSPGRHFLEVKSDGYRRMTRRIFTEKDDLSSLDIKLIRE